jgi:unsaturated rhamnogalacturonyl hydrolase
MTMTSPGSYLRTAGIMLLLGSLALLSSPSWLAAQTTAPSAEIGWDAVPGILARIKAPTFPARDFPITDFGAQPGGSADASESISKAIAACVAAGGGRVVVPAGEFLTGPIVLKSNVNLHLADGSTLKFKTDPAAYLPVVLTRWEGTECYNYSPFIYAFDQENIAITGSGTLDGQSDNQHWWNWTGSTRFGGSGNPNTPPHQRNARNRLMQMGTDNVPVAQRVFGEGSWLRPNFIQPYRCRNVLIEGVKIRRSPMWEIHPVLCTNVTVRGLDIVSHGPNNDGCDPESCKDVLIENCLFDTGDDCIAIKSGRNNDGRRVNVPSENIIVRNCTMKDGHGGVVIGSEISGSVRNVFAENCQMDSPSLDRVLRLKSNAVRGGVLENIFMRNIKVGRVGGEALQIDFLYEEGARGDFKPIARNIVMENVTVASTPRLFSIAGFPGATITGVEIRNSTFQSVAGADLLKDAGTVTLINCTVQPARAATTRSSGGAP